MAAPPRPAGPALAVERSIFRAYDTRGVVGQTLSADVARLIGRADRKAVERAVERELAARGRA